jgi:hypothetical protein
MGLVQPVSVKIHNELRRCLDERDDYQQLSHGGEEIMPFLAWGATSAVGLLAPTPAELAPQPTLVEPILGEVASKPTLVAPNLRKLAPKPTPVAQTPVGFAPAPMDVAPAPTVVASGAFFPSPAPMERSRSHITSVVPRLRLRGQLYGFLDKLRKRV